MRRVLIQCVILSAIVVTTSVAHLFGQVRPEQVAPAFEVASIKRADAFAERPGRLGSVNVVMPPGRLIARNASLKDLTRLGADKPVIDRTGLTGSFKIELDVH